MAYQLGIDISKWQEKVDWNRVRAAEIKFAMMRAVVGTWPDSRFANHWAGSKAVGLLRGAYHYYLDEQDPKAQAKKLFDVLNSTGDLGELPPALDIEDINNPILTASKIKLCLEEIERLFGRTPFVYTRATTWNPRIGKVTWGSRYPLWVAHYTISGWKDNHIQRSLNETKPDCPSIWSNWDIWQFTDKAPASGYGVSGPTVDLDFAEEATLKRLTGKSIPTGTGTGTGTTPPPTTTSDPFDTKDLPALTPSLSVKIRPPGMNIRSNTDVHGSSPGGAVVGAATSNSIHKVLEVTRVNDRIWARIGTGKWVVVEKRDGTVYAEFVNTSSTSTGTGTPPPPPPPPSSDPFDNKALPAVTSALSVRVTTGMLNLRKTNTTANGVPNGSPNGTLSQHAIRKVLEVVRIEDRIWARIGPEQWLVVEKRDGTKYAEFVNA